MDNYDAVVDALKILNAPWGMGIGARHLTVSTVGVPEAMVRLAKEPLNISLALSLHAANDELRQRLVPWARRWSIAELMAAVDEFHEICHRRVSLEYVILQGVNDSQADATALGKLAKKHKCDVNLIAYNAVVNSPFKGPSEKHAKAFCQKVCDTGADAHLRRSMGTDIDAACGQLRRNRMDHQA